MITITVRGTQIFGVSDTPITSGSVGITAKFIFQSGTVWDDLSRVAIFTCGDVTRDILLETDECEIPWEILVHDNIGKSITVGVYGTKNNELVVPTIYTHIGELIRGAEPSSIPPAPPTPSVVDQILQVAQEAENIAQSVRDDANNGVFNGKDGEKGEPGEPGKDGADGYTPIRGVDYWTDADKAEILEDMANEGYIKDTDLSAHTEDRNNPHNVTKAQLRLDKVDNTPDSEKRVAYARDAGWAESALRAGSANNADSAMYDWDGNNIVDTYATKGEVSTTTTALNEHVLNKANPHNVTKAQIGLDKVDNTADADKSVSYAKNAQQSSEDENGNVIHLTYATKEELSTALGDISSALNSIVALQNSYIGGTSA